MTDSHPVTGPVAWTTVAGLVEEIYAGRWSAGGGALSVHASAFQADAAALLRVHPGDQRVEILASTGVMDDTTENPETIWARLLQRRGHLKLRSPMVSTGTRWGSTTSPPRPPPPPSLSPSRPYPLAESQGTGTRTLTTRVNGLDGISWALCFQRNSDGRPFGAGESELLQHLVPHWHRVLALQEAVDDLTARMQAATEIMNHSPTGIITLNPQGRALFVNEEARRIFRQADGVSLVDHRVVVEDSRCRRLYEAAVARLITTSTSPALPFCLLHVPRPSGQPPYQLCVVSRATQEAVIPGLRPAVFVYLRDLQPARAPHPVQLNALYGLTTAEANLCQLLYQGTPLQDAARALGITLNTAKTHRRQAYRKIGVSSQAQLIQRLIVQYWGPAGRDRDLHGPADNPADMESPDDPGGTPRLGA